MKYGDEAVWDYIKKWCKQLDIEGKLKELD